MIVSEDRWGDLECMYKACKAARTDGGSFTDTEEDERGCCSCFWQRIPKYRSMVGKRPVSYFKTWANWRTLESDVVRGASSTVRLNIEMAVEVRRLFWLKHFVCYRSNFILDALLNFEPVKRFKNRRYMSEFGSFRESIQSLAQRDLKWSVWHCGTYCDLHICGVNW